MPNRILKETICTSEDIDKLSQGAEILFYRLMVKADDFGAYFGNESIIKSTCYPLKSDDIKCNQVKSWLMELVNAGLIYHYTAEDGRKYVQFVKWDKHQQVRAKKRKFPERDITCNQMISDDCNSPRNPIQSNTYSYSESNTEEEAGKPPRAPAFKPPTVEEVAAYCQERQNGIDPEAFVTFYEGTNWFRGKTKIKDWKACVRTWEKRDRETPPREKPPQPKPKQYTTAQQYEATKPKTIDSDKLDAVRAAFGL